MSQVIKEAKKKKKGSHGDNSGSRHQRETKMELLAPKLVMTTVTKATQRGRTHSRGRTSDRAGL